MTDEEREKLNICPKCKKPNLTIMVTQTVVAPMSMFHNFTRANMRKKEFEHWGTNWDGMDILCRTEECGYILLADGELASAGAKKMKEERKTITKPRCCSCGTTKNLFKDGWYGYRCKSDDCAIF